MFDVLKGTLRRRLLIGLFLVAGIAGGLAIIKVFKPQYQSEARVVIESLATPFDQSNSAQQDLRPDRITDQFVASQVAVLDSEDLARRILRDLNLVGKPQFDPLAKGMGTAKKLLVASGFSDDPRKMTEEQRALRVLSASKTVYPIALSNVIAVKYTAEDAETAARLANALAETYVTSTRERDTGANDRAREWLGSQIDDLRKKVSDSEAAVEKFRADAGLLKGQTATLGVQKISELNSQITLAEAAASEAQAKADGISRMLRTTGSVDASSEVLGSPLILALRQQQISAQRRLADLSATYLPNHPKMKAAQQEIDNINRQVRREAIKIVDSLHEEANVAAARAETLRGELERLKGREGGALQDEVKLNALEREAAANRTLLENMLSRYADASARQESSLQPGYARIIQTATPAAAPYFPKVGPTLMLTTFAGLGLGLGLAFLLEMMALAGRAAAPFEGDPARPPRERRPRLQNLPDPMFVPDFRPSAPAMAPAMATASAIVPAMPQLVASMAFPPSFSEAQVLLADTHDGRGISDAVNRIAASVSDLQGARAIRSFCAMSIGGGHEAAMVSVALARKLVANGLKTVLVDATARRPSLVDFLALHNGEGLGELVTGAVDFTHIVQRDPQSDARIIRFGLRDDATAQGQIAARIEAIVGALAQMFDVVLVHAGEASPQTAALVRGCNGGILLAAPSRQRDAVAAAATLSKQGLEHALFVKIEPASGAQGSEARRVG